jgi:hypothetical protein
MLIDLSKARAVVRLKGKDVVFAEGGGLVELTLIRLRNLTHAPLSLPGHFWYCALSEVFEIEIRNDDGSFTCFGKCWADKGGLGFSQVPVTEPLTSVDFLILDMKTKTPSDHFRLN